MGCTSLRERKFAIDGLLWFGGLGRRVNSDVRVLDGSGFSQTPHFCADEEC